MRSVIIFFLIIFPFFCSELLAQALPKSSAWKGFETRTVDTSTDEGKKRLWELRHNGQRVSKLVVEMESGDHNSISFQFGKPVFTDSTLTLYSFWCKAGDAPVSPYGARKWVYKLNAAGKLKLVNSALYIETESPSWKKDPGIKFLWNVPKTQNDSLQLNRYIGRTEKEFHASFVLDAEAKQLMNETRAILKSEIDAATKNWESNEAYKSFGIYK